MTWQDFSTTGWLSLQAPSRNLAVVCMMLLADAINPLPAYQAFRREVGIVGDVLDQILAVTWLVSDIALDVLGLLFWSAIGLSLLQSLM